MRKLISILLVAGLAVQGCGLCHHIPHEETIINYKDSTVLNIKDSTVIHEKTRYKDMAWLGDSLVIKGDRSRMWAVADTTREVILGGLEEEPVKEKYKVIYKDKVVVRDSIQRVEVPVEKEVIKEVIPTMFWWSLGLNILFLLGIGWRLYLKFFKKGLN